MKNKSLLLVSLGIFTLLVIPKNVYAATTFLPTSARVYYSNDITTTPTVYNSGTDRKRISFAALNNGRYGINKVAFPDLSSGSSIVVSSTPADVDFSIRLTWSYHPSQYVSSSVTANNTPYEYILADLYNHVQIQYYNFDNTLLTYNMTPSIVSVTDSGSGTTTTRTFIVDYTYTSTTGDFNKIFAITAETAYGAQAGQYMSIELIWNKATITVGSSCTNCGGSGGSGGDSGSGGSGSSVDLTETNEKLDNINDTLNNNWNTFNNTDLDSTDKQLPNTDNYNDYQTAENDLFDKMENADTDSLQVAIDANSSNWVWNRITEWLGTHALLMSFLVSMLSIGIIKMALGR